MRTIPTDRRLRTATALTTALLTALSAAALPARARAALPAPATVGETVIRYADFRDASGLTLNGTAEVVPGTGRRRVLRLTSGLRDQAGTAWAKTRIRPTMSFQSTFDMTMSGGAGHADGLAFVLQTDGAEVVGGLGGSIGYGGLSHSVAVEFDTYANPVDPDNNHVALVTGGRADDPQDAAPAPTPLFGQTLRVRITYDAGRQKLTVRLRPLDGTPAEATVLTRDLDLKSLLGSKRVWAGFTAGTGTSVSTQEIHNWTVQVAA